MVANLNECCIVSRQRGLHLESTKVVGIVNREDVEMLRGGFLGLGEEKEVKSCPRNRTPLVSEMRAA